MITTDLEEEIFKRLKEKELATILHLWSVDDTSASIDEVNNAVGILEQKGRIVKTTINPGSTVDANYHSWVDWFKDHQKLESSDAVARAKEMTLYRVVESEKGRN